MIGRGAQLRVGTSLLDMLVLGNNWTYVAFPAIAFFFSRRTHIDTAVPAIVADPVFRDVFDSCVIGVVNNRFVHVIYACVVVKTIVIPCLGRRVLGNLEWPFSSDYRFPRKWGPTRGFDETR